MRVTDELDIPLKITRDIALHSTTKSLDKLRALKREHVIKVVLVTVLNVDASCDKEAVVKDVIFGVGLVDPFNRHIRVGEESGTQLLIMVVLHEGIGKGAPDDLVEESLKEWDFARKEGFAIHLDYLAHDGPDILNDMDLHAALSSCENRFTHTHAGFICAPDVHENLYAFLRPFQFPDNEVKGWLCDSFRGKWPAQRRVQEVIFFAHGCVPLSEQDRLRAKQQNQEYEDFREDGVLSGGDLTPKNDGRE